MRCLGYGPLQPTRAPGMPLPKIAMLSAPALRGLREAFILAARRCKIRNAAVLPPTLQGCVMLPVWNQIVVLRRAVALDNANAWRYFRNISHFFVHGL